MVSRGIFPEHLSFYTSHFCMQSLFVCGRFLSFFLSLDLNHNNSYVIVSDSTDVSSGHINPFVPSIP